MNRKEQADSREHVVVPLWREPKDIAEAIIMEGKPKFLIRTGTQDQFDIGDRVIIPPTLSQYVGRLYILRVDMDVDPQALGRWFYLDLIRKCLRNSTALFIELL